MHQDETAVANLPDWVPDALRHYLHHTEAGLSFRAIARREGRHASTVMRQCRRFENRRDDPLWDDALTALAQGPVAVGEDLSAQKEAPTMSAVIRTSAATVEAALIEREARRVLRRLVEPGAVLAIAADMDKAAILRDLPDGKTARTGILERSVAQAFALRDWIQCRKPGRIATYEISVSGRAALKRMVEEDDCRAQGMHDAAAPFGAQHRSFATRDVSEEGGTRRVRYNLAESPVTLLARRREKDGTAFLAPELAGAAERLREDFELAQMGPRVTQNWERFLTAGDRGGYRADAGGAEGPRSARERVAAALRDLGPGLGDVALRCCCFLEGLEAAEQRMGWSARSGKIVLRIALQRLHRHYLETYGPAGRMIG